jgi:hypothetical protein
MKDEPSNDTASQPASGLTGKESWKDFLDYKKDSII